MIIYVFSMGLVVCAIAAIATGNPDAPTFLVGTAVTFGIAEIHAELRRWRKL